MRVGDPFRVAAQAYEVKSTPDARCPERPRPAELYVFGPDVIACGDF